MTIINFTPLASFIGGVFIGISAVGLLLVSGRIAGIVGIVRRALLPDPHARSLEALAFIVGLFAASPIFLLIAGTTALQTVSNNLSLLSVAGLLVGFGSILGSGCTSGHGVCGLSRLSPRSIIATLTFMTTGALTVFVVRHVMGG
ncbi:MAG: YeeE/YedE family protein [Hyphomicrobium sp.]